MRCDLIADGIIGAVAEVGMKFLSWCVLKAIMLNWREKINESGLNIIAAKGLTDAAEENC